ncbi:hypothetical protein ACG1BZ_20780 [Microbulbifer sp. CNSA002]|uniref:hypothetical protein n=1 Tax=Microbulbifer sp. CNSA002 TaxID=3373604 RepID=UPI0039B4A5F3
MMDKISINGDWPEIENKELEKLIAQEFWCKNKREDQANILYIKVSGDWIRVYVDYEILFWRSGNNGLEDPKASRETDFGYPLIDWGKTLGIEGTVIKSVSANRITGGAQIEFKFSNNKVFKVQSIDDYTTIKT